MILRRIRPIVTHCHRQNVRSPSPSPSLLAAFTSRNASSLLLVSGSPCPHTRTTSTTTVHHPRIVRIDTRYFHSSNVVQQQKEVDDMPATIPHHKADIQKMTSSAMRDELRLYGINTEPFLEKNDFIAALQKAREQQLVPVMNAMTAMKFELAHYHNITNMDQYLERSELEAAFVQHSDAIRSNMEEIIFHTMHDTTDEILASKHDSNDTGTYDASSEHPTSNSTNDVDENVDDDDVNDDDDDVYTELIYEEMMLICKQSSIQAMHKEMEQQLLISPFQLLKSCLATARVDGIVVISQNTNPHETEKHRLLPSELWKSIKVQDIVTEAYLNPSDRRKSILLPSYYDTTTEETTASKNNDATDAAVTRVTPPLPRIERIQKEMSRLENTSMKLVFNELENVWGISPRCIYVCTIAVLRVLNVMDKERSTADSESSSSSSSVSDKSDVMNDPNLRNLVDRAMSNPQLDSILSQAILKPHIRNLVLAYLENPSTFQPKANDDPEIQQLLSNPVFMEHMKRIVATSSSSNQDAMKK